MYGGAIFRPEYASGTQSSGWKIASQRLRPGRIFRTKDCPSRRVFNSTDNSPPPNFLPLPALESSHMNLPALEEGWLGSFFGCQFGRMGISRGPPPQVYQFVNWGAFWPTFHALEQLVPSPCLSTQACIAADHRLLPCVTF